MLRTARIGERTGDVPWRGGRREYVRDRARRQPIEVRRRVSEPMVRPLRDDAPQPREHRAGHAGAADHLDPEVSRAVRGEDDLDTGGRVRDPGDIRLHSPCPPETALPGRQRVDIADTAAATTIG